MNDDEKIIIRDNNGEIKEYSIIYVFNIGTKEDDYVLYTDFFDNEDAKLKVYSGILKPDGTVCEVTDEEDLKIIEKFIKDFEEELR